MELGCSGPHESSDLRSMSSCLNSDDCFFQVPCVSTHCGLNYKTQKLDQLFRAGKSLTRPYTFQSLQNFSGGEFVPYFSRLWLNRDYAGCAASQISWHTGRMRTGARRAIKS